MKSNRHYLIEQVVVSVVANLLLTIFLGWHSLKGLETIPMWAPAHSRLDPKS